MRAFFVSLWLLLSWLASPLDAQPIGNPLKVTASLQAEGQEPKSGDIVTLAILMQPQSGWHGYWDNPADAGSGAGIDLKWTLPPGVTVVGRPRFPVPKTLITNGFMNYIYDQPYVILVDLKIADTLAGGTILPIAIDALWLACSDRLCVPQQDILRTNLRIGSGIIAAKHRAEFDGYRAAIPAILDQPARYQLMGKQIDIAVPYPASATVKEPYFFPLTSNIFNYAAPQSARRNGDWLILTATVDTPPKDAITGLVRTGEKDGVMIRAVAGAVAKGGVQISGSAQASATPPIWSLIFGALLGGLLLNIMPCVFPILGLKAITLAKAGGDEAAARRDALAYSAGVILSCLILGGIMIALRAGGAEIGWAFQLQQPAIVLALLILMVGITANLYGLFTLGSVQMGGGLARKEGAIGSFWTGALAAIVATPCTGPFMAAAMGAALLLPTLPALLLFACLGLGLALPFLAIAYIPALRRLMPKPGAWMERFRKAMTVPMALTALALLWLLWRLSDVQGLWIGIGAATITLCALFYYDRWRQGFRYTGLALALLILAGLTAVSPLLPLRSSKVDNANKLVAAVPFNKAALIKAQASGQTVFLYFTADWCISCKVNEAAVIQRAETAKLFSRGKVLVMEGDYTRRDPAITRFLEKQGRSGVPLYMVYRPGAQPIILPQLLTQAELAAAITR